MSFLSAFLRPKQSGSAVLFDISAGSVAGACVTASKDTPANIVYAKRAPILAHGEEPKEDALLRALELVGSALIKEGAPALARATGSGRPETILVSFGAPWQTTSLKTEHIEERAPFLVTKARVSEALQDAAKASAGKRIVDESVVGTLLNGYEVADPYGMHAREASIIVLTSSVDDAIADSVLSSCARLYHTREVKKISDISLRYQAIRRAFPHERSSLILDATGPEVSIILVRHGLLVCLYELPDGSVGTKRWVDEVRSGFAELSKNFPLPRTIFLLADEHAVDELKEELDKADLAALWLAEEPPTIVPVLRKQLTSFVTVSSTESPDIRLTLMALYFRDHLLP